MIIIAKRMGTELGTEEPEADAYGRVLFSENLQVIPHPQRGNSWEQNAPKNFADTAKDLINEYAINGKKPT
jgi:hypothetical protein